MNSNTEHLFQHRLSSWIASSTEETICSVHNEYSWSTLADYRAQYLHLAQMNQYLEDISHAIPLTFTIR